MVRKEASNIKPITAIARNSRESATIEELPIEPTTTAKSSSEYPTVSRKVD